MTARQIQNKKDIEDEKIITDNLKNRRNILLKEIEPLINDVKSWYAYSKKIYNLDNNKILTLIWNWEIKNNFIKNIFFYLYIILSTLYNQL